MPVAQGDRSDDTGAFRVYGLPPGDYYVSARSDGMTPMMMPDARLATGDSDQGYAPTYYPGTPSPADAERVTVAVGQEVAGIASGSRRRGSRGSAAASSAGPARAAWAS